MMQSIAKHDAEEITAISACMTGLLAQVLTLQIRTKGCHWHVTGHQFRSLHALFDEQAEELADLADEMAERSRALGATTISSLADVLNAYPEATTPPAALGADEMLNELRAANFRLAAEMKALRVLADSHVDIVTVSATDDWLSRAERRIWMLKASVQEASR